MTFSQLITELKLYPMGVWQELRNVTWPGPRQVLHASLTVAVIVTLATVIVGLLDVAFSQAMSYLL